MSIWDGIGSVLSKIFDWLPGTKRSYTNKISSIKRKMHELQQKESSDKNIAKYQRLVDDLKLYERKLREYKD